MSVLGAERAFAFAAFYVPVALGSGILSVDEARSLFWTAAACVVALIAVHGATAVPLGRRLLPQPPQP